MMSARLTATRLQAALAARRAFSVSARVSNDIIGIDLGTSESSVPADATARCSRRAWRRAASAPACARPSCAILRRWCARPTP